MSKTRFYQNTKTLEQYPSVTEVTACAMKIALLYFYGKHGTQKAKQIAAEAAAIGTDLHHYIKTDLENNKDVVIQSKVKDLEICIANYHKIKQELELEPIYIEQLVHSDKYKYAGTLDLVTRSKHGILLLDWKTSKAIYFDYKLQLNAYYQALIEWSEVNNRESVEGLNVQLCIARCDKEKEFNAKTDILTEKPNKKILKGFLGLLDYYNCKKEFENKKEE